MVPPIYVIVFYIHLPLYFLVRMVWEDWLASVAPILGTTTTQAGVIMSLIFTFVFVLMGGLVAPKKGTEVGMSITALFFTFLFTYVEWYPIWTGTALSLILAFLTAIVIKSAFES